MVFEISKRVSWCPCVIKDFGEIKDFCEIKISAKLRFRRNQYSGGILIPFRLKRESGVNPLQPPLL